MRVGVLVPVHGWAPYLAETLDAVLAQRPAPDAVVVVDDASPEPVALHPDHADRCRLVRRDRRGGPDAARRTGFDALDTDWFALCDADDAWRPGKLAAQLAAVRSTGEPAPGAVFSRAVVVGPDGRATGEHWPDPPTRLPDLFEANPVCTSGVLLRRDAVEAVGGIGDGPGAAEDWDLWLRLLAAGERLVLAPDAVVAYRRRAGSLSAGVAELARAQLAVHDRHAALVGPDVRGRVEAADLRALAAGLTREGDIAGARAALRAAAVRAPLGRADRARLAALAVPGLRSRLGRRDPYRR